MNVFDSKGCGCGRTYSPYAWRRLRLIGICWALGEKMVEFRNCECGSTLAVKMPGGRPQLPAASSDRGS